MSRFVQVLVCRLCALLFSALSVTMSSLVLMLLLGRTMSWYDTPGLLLPLYAAPTVATNLKVFLLKLRFKMFTGMCVFRWPPA